MGYLLLVIEVLNRYCSVLLGSKVSRGKPHQFHLWCDTYVKIPPSPYPAPANRRSITAEQ